MPKFKGFRLFIKEGYPIAAVRRDLTGLGYNIIADSEVLGVVTVSGGSESDLKRFRCVSHVQALTEGD